MKYKPRNLTIVWGRPLPWENCAGLLSIAPTFGMLLPATGRLGAPPAAALAPSVLPGVVKEAEDLAGPLAASAAAERMAVRSAVALAPRTVSCTLPFLRIKNVGILVMINQLGCPFLEFRCRTHAEMPYVLATSFWLSTFTLAKTMRPGFDSAVARVSKMGEMTLQGPHQSA